MHAAINEFAQYAGLDKAADDASGRFSMQLESGATINIEPAQADEQLIVSVFYPSPWKLLELGARALKQVHYRHSTGRTIGAGIFGDCLVLSTRLARNRQAPPEIERAAHELYLLAQQCAQQSDQRTGAAAGGQGT